MKSQVALCHTVLITLTAQQQLNKMIYKSFTVRLQEFDLIANVSVLVEYLTST